MLNFNTPETLNALGVATGDISQMCLSRFPAPSSPCKDSPKKRIAHLQASRKIQYAVTEQRNQPSERSLRMNGITYTRQGDYNLPNLLPRRSRRPSGKYALLRKKFLKEHRRITYTNLLTSGQLSSHLAEIEQTAQRQMEQMVTQMAKENGVTGGAEGARPDEVGAADEQPSRTQRRRSY